MNERSPEDMPNRAARNGRLVYLNRQVVNLDRVAEIALTVERVTVAFAFVSATDPRGRLMLSWQEAQPLLSALHSHHPGWVALPHRLINLDLAVDVWVTQTQVTLIAAQSNAWGGPIPRRWSRSDAQPLVAYFQDLVRSSTAPAGSTNHCGWIAVGDHMVNLTLVTQLRFGTHQAQLIFAGLPRFARSFAYDEAAPLLDRLQEAGVLPIEAVRRPPATGGAPDDEAPDSAPATPLALRAKWNRRRRWRRSGDDEE